MGINPQTPNTLIRPPCYASHEHLGTAGMWNLKILVSKDANFFSCTQSESNKHLLVPITVEDEVSFTNKYSLIATINHSGTLNRGHYWAFIKDLHSSSWYSCNGKLVFNVEERSVNNSTPYILFYRKVSMFPRIYQIFWRFFLSFQTLSLGVITPHITPVLYGNWLCSLNFQALRPCSP